MATYTLTEEARQELINRMTRMGQVAFFVGAIVGYILGALFPWQ